MNILILYTIANPLDNFSDRLSKKVNTLQTATIQ